LTRNLETTTGERASIGATIGGSAVYRIHQTVTLARQICANLSPRRHHPPPRPSMDYFRRFTFLLYAPAFDPDELEGLRLHQIVGAVEKSGFEVIKARRIEDAELAIKTNAAIGCMVVDWGKKGLDSKAAALIAFVRKRGLEMPIILLVRRKRFEDLPIDVLDNVDGYVFLSEETPEFIAKNLVSRLKQYAETLKTPFFGELVDYAEEGNQLWTCPGHNGGVFYSRSPIGRIFV
jgi:ornithine decarboxylase